MIDPSNAVIKLCMEGNQAEFEGRIEDARLLFRQAWDEARDDYEACIAAHYMARFQESPEEIFYWNREALARAERVGDIRVQGFYPSLYVNMGHAHELLGHAEEAKRFFDLAAKLGLAHAMDFSCASQKSVK